MAFKIDFSCLAKNPTPGKMSDADAILMTEIRNLILERTRKITYLHDAKNLSVWERDFVKSVHNIASAYRTGAHSDSAILGEGLIALSKSQLSTLDAMYSRSVNNSVKIAINKGM